METITCEQVEEMIRAGVAFRITNKDFYGTLNECKKNDGTFDKSSKTWTFNVGIRGRTNAYMIFLLVEGGDLEPVNAGPTITATAGERSFTGPEFEEAARTGKPVILRSDTHLVNGNDGFYLVGNRTYAMPDGSTRTENVRQFAG